MNISRKTMTLTAVCALTAAIAFGASNVQAETFGSTVTATVQNTFTLAETQPLSFGTIIAINDVVAATAPSTLAVDSAGVSTFGNTGGSRLVAVTAAAQGIYTIAGAAPLTSLTLTLPGSITLACTVGCVGSADFTVDTFVDDVTGAPTTDAGGAATFSIGATLNTIPGIGASPYGEGAYDGALIVTVDY